MQMAYGEVDLAKGVCLRARQVAGRMESASVKARERRASAPSSGELYELTPPPPTNP